jgi:hypothetical protein
MEMMQSLNASHEYTIVQRKCYGQLRFHMETCKIWPLVKLEPPDRGSSTPGVNDEFLR